MPELFEFEGLTAQIESLMPAVQIGRVQNVEAGVIHVSGLANRARIGDLLQVKRALHGALDGEIVQISGDLVIMLPDGPQDGVALNDMVQLRDAPSIAPTSDWMGRIIDPLGRPLDGRHLAPGARQRPLRAAAPAAANRRAFGSRLNTGLKVMNTVLPLVSGQRVGLFAGSGVGKSSLLGHLASHVDTDVVVIAMIGERGRELRQFVEDTLGPDGLAKSVIIAATSDQSALIRRRCAWTAMAVAEFFRDKGQSVLFLADSITRFAEAHREVAVSAGEAPVLRGFPPSTSHMIMSLCERAGPGSEGQGDITAVFSVLVAGSDMDEPIADILRGVLDGHIVLERSIAERGRYPAINLLRSVSRSLPNAASAKENEMIQVVRKYLSLFEDNSAMIRAGLYSQGSNEEIDNAIALHPDLDAFLGKHETADISNSFSQLELILRRAGILLGAKS